MKLNSELIFNFSNCFRYITPLSLLTFFSHKYQFILNCKKNFMRYKLKGKLLIIKSVNNYKY